MSIWWRNHSPRWPWESGKTAADCSDFSWSSRASRPRFSASDRPASDCGAIVTALPTMTMAFLVQEGGQEGIDLVAGEVIDAGE